MSIRDKLEDWDCLFFEKDKNKNQFFSYAVSRGFIALPTTVIGIELSMVVQAICEPTSQRVMGASAGAVFALLGIGFVCMGLMAGKAQRRAFAAERLQSPQPQ
jgi:hypothetical protein